jgi:hypothetical protein
MNTQEKFYVYEHIRPDTKAVFYVGKGCGNRAFTSFGRNKHWNNIVNKNQGKEVCFLAKDLDEELAFLCEIEAIDKYRRLGIKLVNKTNGGEGVSGMFFSKEHKQKLSEAKQGIKNNFFGKQHSEKTKEILRVKSGSRKHTNKAKAKIKKTIIETYKNHSKSKPVFCVTNGVTYFSTREAARQLNLHRQCVSLCCQKKIHHTAGYKFEWSIK